ncbi:protein C-mannosyl-transferase DPY19L1-like [Branchiostoma lanceolatum]|uniref:protein C-mannosyl-transferase DPY19L1-like n=1 Tax=Branchiostoma lanceolatum TaxID=7740 RepID=UPI0034558F74
MGVKNRRVRPGGTAKSTSESDGAYSLGFGSGVARVAVISVVAIVFSVLHGYHISSMFESDRHFSHLSTLERELTFRTEMGLYYSYFKTIAESRTFLEGLHSVMYDNVTEYPTTINVLKRFNLYPEVVLAATYRAYEAVMGMFEIPTKLCWTVNRGEGMSPVQSCEGMGEPAYFYVNSVFVQNGLMMGLFFIFGTYLSGSMVGGLLTVACFFYNHGECTRVQWTPPLRESFAFPMLALQMFLLTYMLRSRSVGWKHVVLLAACNVTFILPWQFAQFALLTQMTAVFLVYVMGFIPADRVKAIVTGHILGLMVSYVLLFGNEMLLTSFYASCLLTVMAVVSFEPLLQRQTFSIATMALQGIVFIVGCIGLKIVISKVLNVTDDAHIANILRSKFSDYRDFHTMLYTCAVEFGFMQLSTPIELSQTLVLPAGLVVVVMIIYKCIFPQAKKWFALTQDKEPTENGTGTTQSESDSPKDDDETPIDPSAALVYHLLQLMAFFLLALIIMRLKLFFTPQLCLAASLLASRQLFGWVGNQTRHALILFLILGAMSIKGSANLRHQWSILGEFSNVPHEEMMEWMVARTPPDAVFAGAMPTMASIKLSAHRAIVNHPHYEDAGLRERTKRVYGMYSRKPVEQVHRDLQAMGVTHFVLEHSWCHRRTKVGCSLPEIWDVEEPENVGKHPTCDAVKKKPEPYFKVLFKNKIYVVLKVLQIQDM